MQKFSLTCSFLFCLWVFSVNAQNKMPDKELVSPNTSGKGWVSLFNDSLTNAIFPAGVWTVQDGVLTASKDEAIWSEKAYDDFVLDLEFKNAPETNSGVIVHASNTEDWIPHSVEIQIADDWSDKWAKVEASWQCAAIFGHQPATQRIVKKPGEWNHYTITCKGRMIWVALNGQLVNTCDMSLYTSAKDNIDGTKAPDWLSNPMATLPLHGHIGLQGKHAGAPIYFRNIRIRELK
ncbi:MAG TPA: DUF1080 domain-containing protein [Puia sp.]|nr:DUF1080 domain-containing protein [Puia sp.]